MAGPCRGLTDSIFERARERAAVTLDTLIRSRHASVGATDRDAITYAVISVLGMENAYRLVHTPSPALHHDLIERLTMNLDLLEWEQCQRRQAGGRKADA